MTFSEFQEKANIPVELKKRNLLKLNDVDRYIIELTERVNRKGGAV